MSARQRDSQTTRPVHMSARLRQPQQTADDARNPLPVVGFGREVFPAGLVMT